MKKKKGNIARIKPLGETRLKRRSFSGLGMLSSFGTQTTFTTSDVIPMFDDDQVSLGMEYLKIPIAKAPIVVKTSKPEAYAYACDLYMRIWNCLIPKLNLYLGYGWCCYEPLYKKDQHDVRYWDFSDFEIAPPLGSVPWTNNDKISFVAVDMGRGFGNFYMDNPESIEGKMILEGPGVYRPSKALWLTNDPLMSRWFGRSVLRASHMRWRAKTMPDGVLENLLKASYKASFSGLLLEYPANTSVTAEDGSQVSSEEYADFICQVIKTGTNIRLPSTIDGQPGWKILEYAKNLVRLADLQIPLDYLDRGILRGMGIPDEILTHDGNTGGYSRSLISVDAFYSRGETRAMTILPSVTDYIVAPLCRQRYGPDCEVTAQIIRQDRPGDDDGGDGQQDASDGMMGQEGKGGGGRGVKQIGMSKPEPQPAQSGGIQDQQGKFGTRFSIAMAKTAERIKRKKEFSSTQLDLDAPMAELVKRLTARMPASALAAKGIEEKPHITVRYGLHDNDPDDAKEIVNEFPGPIKVKLGSLSIFNTEEADVLKIDVISPELHELNKALSSLHHTDTYPDYKPHLTLAYLLPGTGERWLTDNPLSGLELSFNSVTFSNKQREKTLLALQD